MAKQINEFEILDHGINHSQFFEGCGVAYTKYEDCVTGCGFASAKEAAEDALEQLTQIGYIIPAELDAEIAAMSENDDVTQSYIDSNERVPEDSEMYYYISIRVK